MREAKFNFIPAHQIPPKGIEYTERVVTLATAPQKKLTFSSKDPENRALIGKYLKFYVDKGKNVLGWKVFTTGELSDLKNVSRVNSYQSKAGLLISVSASTPLRGLNAPEKSYKKLRVEKYMAGGLLNDGSNKPFFYITIPKRTKKS